ncbi:hypothetical protein B9H02_11445 [Prosthecochloris sp. HL-130-GSB]|nr:hypothetical protein B9H02_11445 [Prosthecochloris sp. HL-130-GSB]
MRAGMYSSALDKHSGHISHSIIAPEAVTPPQVIFNHVLFYRHPQFIHRAVKAMPLDDRHALQHGTGSKHTIPKLLIIIEFLI